jgi:hypothetical protein
MAIDIDVQNDKFPYLARQICGDIAKAFGYGIDHVYEVDQPFLNMLKNFSIDTLYGDWLDELGLVLGLPRPYTTNPFGTNSFEFDNTEHLLDGVLHGFSTTRPVTIDGVVYDRSKGGLLDSIYRTTDETPIIDDIYRKYLSATSLLKKTHSIQNIADVLELFIDSTRYAITFISTAGYVNDILITMSATSADYLESLQVAFNKIFTIPPFVLVDVSLDFDNIYTVPTIENIVEEVTGSSTGYTVVYSIEDTMAVFTITLDSSLTQYENEVRLAVEAHFAGADDVVIVVEVE